LIKPMRRMLYIPILHIDANLINAKQKLAPVNQLERWYRDGVILINMASTAHTEAKAGNSPLREAKANQQIFTASEPAGSRDATYKQVEAALFEGGAQNDNQRNDVAIVCEAIKYNTILVTGDGGSKAQPGGILGNREKLKDLLQIMSPDEAVAFVREKIQERDDFNRRVVKERGGDLPEWTGKD
jgi:hypothetical protein